MKRVLFILSVLVLFLGQSGVVSGQHRTRIVPHDLSPADYKQMDRNVRITVDLLNNNIRNMADREKKNRERYKRSAEDLFIGKCLQFPEIIKDSSGRIIKIITNRGVTMELATLYKQRKYTRLMREYFTNVLNFKYETVHIAFSDIADMKMSRPNYIGTDEDGNDMYECTVTYIQYFKGITKENIICEDLTTKTIKVQVTEYFEPNFATGQLEPCYQVLLGNVYVDKIEEADIETIFELNLN